MWSRLATAAVAAALLAACSAPGADPHATVPTAPPRTVSLAPGTTTSVDLDGRPYRLHVPAGVTDTAALVVGLHGYTSTSSELDGYLGLTAASDERGFLLALPEGTTDQRGDQFWNATGSCCDLDRTGVDDSGYLSRLVTQVTASYAVSRVVVVGHSNGGYMAHRFACDHADQVTAIASLAGPLPADTSLCAPSRPVTVLHVHGTDDTTVPYAGRPGDSSALVTAQTWARLDGCAPTGATSTPAIDVDTTIAGAETSVTTWADGCRDGSRVELWSIGTADHVPHLSAGFTPAMLDLLLG